MVVFLSFVVSMAKALKKKKNASTTNKKNPDTRNPTNQKHLLILIFKIHIRSADV